MAAAPGAIVRIAPYDWTSRTEPPPNAGDYLATPAGSAYEILDILPTRRPRRFRVVCLKLAGVDDIPENARIANLSWYSRKKKRS